MLWEKPCFATSAWIGSRPSWKDLNNISKDETLIDKGIWEGKGLEFMRNGFQLNKWKRLVCFLLIWCKRKMQLQREMLIMLEEEELYWFKRSHERWFHEGDSNTKFFQRIANGERGRIPFYLSKMLMKLLKVILPFYNMLLTTTRCSLGLPLGMLSLLILIFGMTMRN